MSKPSRINKGKYKRQSWSVEECRAIRSGNGTTESHPPLFIWRIKQLPQWPSLEHSLSILSTGKVKVGEVMFCDKLVSPDTLVSQNALPKHTNRQPVLLFGNIGSVTDGVQ
ncbi:unnamed protein product [Natator depressus]